MGFESISKSLAAAADRGNPQSAYGHDFSGVTPRRPEMMAIWNSELKGGYTTFNFAAPALSPRAGCELHPH